MQKDSILSHTGENYEYIRTIIDNKIKLLYLELADSTSRLLGYLIIGIILFTIISLTSLGAIIALTIWLSGYVGSAATGIMISATILGLFGLMIFLFRKRIIFIPTTRLILSIFYEKK
jgi:hypothetical protein